MVATPQLDKLIVDAARLGIFTVLYVEREVEFERLRKLLGMTAGNLAGHLRRLEKAGYVEVRKSFKGRRPRTTYRLTEGGKKAFEDAINRLRYVVGLSRVPLP